MNTKIYLIISLLLIAGSTIQVVRAQNPCLPPTAFNPDPEPHVFEYKGEKRLFIYGSRDEVLTDFCGYGHDVWSAPLDDLSQWTNHGEVFNVKQILDLGYGKVDNQLLFAPDCVYNPVTKKFYLYVLLGKPYKMDGIQGPLKEDTSLKSWFEDYGPITFVAESESPVGPFVNPRVCDWPAGSKHGAFDPGVLVLPQDDGNVRVYAYWGAKRPNARWAEIDPYDMCTIINGKTKKRDITSYYMTLNNPELNNYSIFFEASSIRQVAKDKFVFIYSARERTNALTYCYSNSPEGPWTYGGRIVDNGVGWYLGNNHGSIVDVDGQWYVVYHRRTNNDYNRQAMIEPIEVRIEGDKVIIPQVEMTSQGVRTDGLDAFHRYQAGTICYLTRGVYVNGSERCPDGLNPVVIAGKQPVIGWKYFNFGTKPLTRADRLTLRLNASIRSDVTGSVQVALPADAGNQEKRITIARFQWKKDANDVYKDRMIPVDLLDSNDALHAMGGLSGKLAVYINFDNEEGEPCRIKEIEFRKR